MQIRKKYYLLLLLLSVCKPTVNEDTTAILHNEHQVYVPPAEMYGTLLHDVQMSQLFPDGKTFVDCKPKTDPASIVETYKKDKSKYSFDLATFVDTHFERPDPMPVYSEKSVELPIEDHINRLWRVLRRPADSSAFGSRIRLPYPYVVPGGRFREIYYWDSYFTMLGLEISGEYDLIEDMVNNFAFMIDQFGFIPNGCRTYFLGRSQPPFFALMVELLASIKGDHVWEVYLPHLQREYDFWMEGSASLTVSNPTSKRTVLLDSKYVLNRYWDNLEGPREEGWAEDILLAKESGRNENEVYKHLRAGAESGWDYSSRWLADGQNLQTIETSIIIPIDLNSLLYKLELTLYEAYKLNGMEAQAAEFLGKARIRKEAIDVYCWDEQRGYFMDYNFIKRASTGVPSLAGVYPLSFKLATNNQAIRSAGFVAHNFLRDGGLVSTLNSTGQQWDAPNGWPPLQWMSYMGLKNYHADSLAKLIGTRWLELNERVYERTGKMMEKYNVEDVTLEGGGGEYPLQDGFGWTNGVYLKLKAEILKE